MELPSCWPDVTLRWVHELVQHHRVGEALQGKAGVQQVADACDKARVWLVTHQPEGFELSER